MNNYTELNNCNSYKDLSKNEFNSLAHEFKTKADGLLSDDPQTRVPETVKAVLAKPDYMLDTHLHIFNLASVLPESQYFRLWKPLLSNVMPEGDNGAPEVIIKEIDEQPEGYYNDFKKHYTPPRRDREFLLDIKRFDFDNVLHDLLNKKEKDVLEEYIKRFGLTSPDKIITTPLMMDMEFGWKQSTKDSLSIQIQRMKDLQNDHAVLPFLAVDPRRDNIFNIFLDAFSGPNPLFGVKVYPPLGYLPSDPVLMSIFEVCEKYNIPVTTHCGGTTIAAKDTSIEIWGKEKRQFAFEDVRYFLTGSYKEKANYLMHPRHWEPVLDAYPKLRLNFGHFGDTEEWQLVHDNEHSEIIHHIEQLLKRDNVFADFSFNLGKTDLAFTIKESLDNSPLLREKTFYGTDFWVALSISNFRRKLEYFKDANKQHWKRLTQDNPRRFLGI